MLKKYHNNAINPVTLVLTKYFHSFIHSFIHSLYHPALPIKIMLYTLFKSQKVPKYLILWHLWTTKNFCSENAKKKIQFKICHYLPSTNVNSLNNFKRVPMHEIATTTMTYQKEIFKILKNISILKTFQVYLQSRNDYSSSLNLFNIDYYLHFIL